MKTIWVDGDGCSREARRILFRLAEKGQASIQLVANRTLRIKETSHVRMIVVNTEEGAVDHYILAHVGGGDIVITRDVLLAQQLLAKNAHVLSDRGRVFHSDTIRYHLSLKQAAEQIRALQPHPSRYRQTKQRFSKFFANELVNLLCK